MAHPYKDLEDTNLWDVVYGAIDDLVKNQDIMENTSRTYIVGYIVKKLFEMGWRDERSK